jgi:hypothetical protein
MKAKAIYRMTVVFISYILHKLLKKLHIFRIPINVHILGICSYVALQQVSRHKFQCPPWCYYWGWNYKAAVAFNSTTFVSSFVKIRQAVHKFKVGSHRHRQHRHLISPIYFIKKGKHANNTPFNILLKLPHASELSLTLNILTLFTRSWKLNFWRRSLILTKCNRHFYNK